MLSGWHVKIVPFIACAGLPILAGCRQPPPFPGNTTPVNANAMPSPDVSATEAAATGTEAAPPVETATPASAAPAATPSPAPPAASPSPSA